MNIPEIVKEYVLKNNKRMPETESEINAYLDLINHAKKYAESISVSLVLTKRMMKKLGFKTTDEIKKEGEELFKQ